MAETQVHYDLDETEAKILYAILRIHEDDVYGLTKQAGRPLGATQERVSDATGIPYNKIGRFLGDLCDAGYVVSAQIPSSYGRNGRGKPRIVYELRAETAITCRD